LKASIEGLRRRQPIRNIYKKKAFEFNYEMRERLKAARGDKDIFQKKKE
jgi:hypothetical protein